MGKKKGKGKKRGFFKRFFGKKAGGSPFRNLIGKIPGVGNAIDAVIPKSLEDGKFWKEERRNIAEADHKAAEAARQKAFWDGTHDEETEDLEELEDEILANETGKGISAVLSDFKAFLPKINKHQGGAENAENMLTKMMKPVNMMIAVVVVIAGIFGIKALSGGGSRNNTF